MIMLLLMLLCAGCTEAWGQYIVKVLVHDNSALEIVNIEGALVYVDNTLHSRSDADGLAVVKVEEGVHLMKVSHPRYGVIEFKVSKSSTCLVDMADRANESGLAGVSVIDEEGTVHSEMTHYQRIVSKSDSLFQLAEDCYSKYVNCEDENEEKVLAQQAFNLYQQAAELNHSSAMRRLASFFERGEIVKRDIEKTMSYLHKAAELQDSVAMYELGSFYEQECNDISQAVLWYQKGAISGCLSAQFRLAEMYEGGIGVEKNIDKAMEWYQRAQGSQGTIAEQHLPSAPLPALPLQKRIALLIGNGDYESGRLLSVQKDWQDMNLKLKELGFETVCCSNVEKREFKSAVRAFREKVKAGGYDALLFYYAGHGVQSRGANYLVPIGDFYSDDSDIEEEYISMNWVLNSMAETGVKTRIFILDACREQPLALTRGAAQGLAGMGNTPGVFMAYSTLAGKTAKDKSDSGNSPYMSALLQELDVEQEPIDRVFEKVKERVSQQTGGRQQPSHVNDLDVSNGLVFLNRNARP